MLYPTDLDVRVWGMDDKQADSEKIGGGRNVVPKKNVAHTMDSEENKWDGIEGGRNQQIIGAEDKKTTSNIFYPCNEKGGFGKFSHW